MAAPDIDIDSRQPSSPVGEGGHETSYLFVRSLGTGAFAEANLYRKTEDNSLVVWKEVNMARLGEKERRDAVNEIDILFLLNHANIVTYYNHFLDGDTLLIEMEYANGGTLAQKIENQKELLDETIVLWYLFQITSALAHIHEHGIIHRDVKTLNIFMTKSDLVKLGDFGISKIMESTSQLAETVAGTPLYMSPELMKGIKYDYKVDIWALGCVLYELLTLTRTFQASNRLRLAYEIVCGEHGDVDPRYSQAIRNLVHSMLSKEPENRPSAEEILQSDVLQQRKGLERKVYELNTVARRIRLQSAISVQEQTVVPVVKSKTAEVYQWGGGKLTPKKLDIFVKGRSAVQVDAGPSHFTAVTMEKELYTWANVQGGSKVVGQLGHDDTAAYKNPKRVEALEGKGIIQAMCGEDFTVAVTDEGDLYTFGSDYYGCLGVEGEEGDEVMAPVPVNFFSNHPVQEVACGDNHVVALTLSGSVYTWGCGEYGRLGLGSEDDFNTPQKAETPKKHVISHVFAGADGTFLLTSTGRVVAAGSNEHNKLGFNSEASGLKKRKPKVYDIPCKYTFTLVRPLTKHNVVSIAAGHTHSAIINICGHLHTFGSNKYGQLGLGDFREHTAMCRVTGIISSHRVEKVTCGDSFTIVSTSDNHVYAWGNGQDGRLGGISPDQLEHGRGPNGKCVSIPRPIFGALHVVPHISSRHWHTILIAEKVLNQKTLKTRGSLPKMRLFPARNIEKRLNVEAQVNLSDLPEAQGGLSPDSAIAADFGTSSEFVSVPQFSEGTKDSGRPGSIPGCSLVTPEIVPPICVEETANDAELPPWLAMELQDDVIPIPSDFDLRSSGVQPNQFQCLPPPSESDLHLDIHSDQTASAGSFAFTPKEDTDATIMSLQERIAELETENRKLKLVIDDQQATINSFDKSVPDDKSSLH